MKLTCHSELTNRAVDIKVRLTSIAYLNEVVENVACSIKITLYREYEVASVVILSACTQLYIAWDWNAIITTIIINMWASKLYNI